MWRAIRCSTSSVLLLAAQALVEAAASVAGVTLRPVPLKHVMNLQQKDTVSAFHLTSTPASSPLWADRIIDRAMRRRGR